STITDLRTRPLAISLGDPAGIGPELIIAAWARREGEGLAPFFVAGGASVLRAAAGETALELVEIGDPAEAAPAFRHGLPVLGTADGAYRPGQPDEDGARLALA